MRRTERLFQIIQILRRETKPMTGRELAEELEVSLRTLYRDMAELIAQRVPIRGEAGTGYVLDQGYDLPPLMLTADELEAAVLGARWVEAHGDAQLARGAKNLVGKLLQVVPEELQPVVVDAGLVPVSFRNKPEDTFDVGEVREAIRQRHRVVVDYADENGNRSHRIIWPFQIAYFETTRLICAWCELREGFRHFRTDRVMTFASLQERYPERISILRQKWKAQRTMEDAACNDQA